MGVSFSFSFIPVDDDHLNLVDNIFDDFARIDRPQRVIDAADGPGGPRVASYHGLRRVLVDEDVFSGNDMAHLSVSLAKSPELNLRPVADLKLRGARCVDLPVDGPISLTFIVGMCVDFDLLPSNKAIPWTHDSWQKYKSWDNFVRNLFLKLEPSGIEHSASFVEKGWGPPHLNSAVYHRRVKDFVCDIGRIRMSLVGEFLSPAHYADQRPLEDQLAEKLLEPKAELPLRFLTQLEPTGELQRFLEDLDDGAIRRVVSSVESIPDSEVSEVLADSARLTGSFNYHRIGNGGVIVTQPQGSVFRAYEHLLNAFA